jgi:hypothetical protein
MDLMCKELQKTDSSVPDTLSSELKVIDGGVDLEEWKSVCAKKLPNYKLTNMYEENVGIEFDKAFIWVGIHPLAIKEGAHMALIYCYSDHVVMKHGQIDPKTGKNFEEVWDWGALLNNTLSIWCFTKSTAN